MRVVVPQRGRPIAPRQQGRRLGSGRAGWALLRNCQKDLIDSQSGRVSSCLVRHGGRAQGAPRRRFQASTPPRRPPPLCPPSPQIGQHSPIPLPSFFPRALALCLCLSVSVALCLSLTLSVCAVRVRIKLTAEDSSLEGSRTTSGICLCLCHCRFSLAGRRDVIAGWGIWSPGAIRRELGLEPFLGPRETDLVTRCVNWK
jgi:hypothetical protein